MTGCLSSQGYMVNRAGQTFYDRGNYAQAAMEFQRAVAVDPYNADYVSNLASALKKQGNLPAAEQTWRQALNINPSHQPSYHGLAQMMIENSRQQEASQLLTSWAQAQPYSAEPYLEMAWLNRESGNAAGTQQSLQQALSINPNHPKALASMGQYYQDVGQMAAATTMYQRSLQNNWYQPEVQSRLATLRGFESPEAAMPQTQLAQLNASQSMQFPPVPQFARSEAIGGTTPQMAFRPLPQNNAITQIPMPQVPAAQVAYGQQLPNVAMQPLPQAPLNTAVAAQPQPFAQPQIAQAPANFNGMFTPPMMATLPPQPAAMSYPTFVRTVHSRRSIRKRFCKRVPDKRNAAECGLSAERHRHTGSGCACTSPRYGSTSDPKCCAYAQTIAAGVIG